MMATPIPPMSQANVFGRGALFCAVPVGAVSFTGRLRSRVSAGRRSGSRPDRASTGVGAQNGVAPLQQAHGECGVVDAVAQLALDQELVPRGVALRS